MASSASIEVLKERSKAQVDHRFGLKSWLNAAQRTRALAVDADGRGDSEAAYVGYRKTVNLVRALLDHPEFKHHSTHKSSPEYYSYMDLKQKLLPTTSRMQELEKTLSHKGSEQTTSNDDSLSRIDAIGTVTPFEEPMTPSGTGESSSSGGSTMQAGQGHLNGYNHASSSSSKTTTPTIPKSAPPPIPPTSSKPPVPSSSTKPSTFSSAPSSASSLSSAKQQQSPLTPTLPVQHGKHNIISSTSHRVSDKLKERMAALHNAGMRDSSDHPSTGGAASSSSSSSSQPTSTFSHIFGHHHHSHQAQSHASSSTFQDHHSSNTTGTPVDASGKPPVAPKPFTNGTSSGMTGLKRSPAMKYGQSASPADVSTFSSLQPGTSGTGSRGDEASTSQASTLPSMYSQEEDLLDPWPPQHLLPKHSSESLAQDTSRPHAHSPPRASPMEGDKTSRSESAPPATHGPPDASGPATSQEGANTDDYDTITDEYFRSSSHSNVEAMQGHEHGLRPHEGHDVATRYAAMASPSSLDNFANRFPDVEQAGFDIIPSTSIAKHSAPPSHQHNEHGGIVKPFLPAPSSTETYQYQGQNVRSSRSESQSTVQTHSTGGSAPGVNRSSVNHMSTASASSQQEQRFANRASTARIPSSKPPRPLPKPPSLPSLPNRSSTTLESAELWRLLEASQQPGGPSILLIDVRTRKEFSTGHIKGKAVCIEPFTLSSNSSAFSIETSLVVSPDKERQWFSERANFDLIVVYDKHTRALSSRNSSTSSSNVGQRNGPVSFRSIADQVEDSAVSSRTLTSLFSAIYELNFSDENKRLKRSPLLLVGGWEAWLKEIGDKGVQREEYHTPQYHSYQSQHQPKQTTSPAIPNGHTSLPPLQPAKAQPNRGSTYESDYQEMLANRAQTESTLESRSISGGTQVSPDVKRQHRKAVLSGESVLSPARDNSVSTSANAIVYLPSLTRPVQMPLPGPPPPTYPGIAMPPVAVHRTGPASPYDAYPSSAYRSQPYTQASSSQEYFDQTYNATQRNAYQPSQQPQGFLQQYPNGRPIEYPTLQQRQRFGDVANQMPIPPVPNAAVTNNVQRPPPALARAPSSSLHLYQTGDYLSNPTFGQFPKAMTTLGDGIVGLTGLKNLGNTCYMNSMIQCLSATIPLARFFKEGSYKRAINRTNFLGTKGVLADAVAQLIQSLWSEQYSFLAPVTFREAICRFAPQFKGSDQHDSQEFLAFMLDGLHEDLNLVINKPPPIEFTPEREKELETLPTQIAAEREWNIYLRRDDSIIVRLMQGQYKSQLRCLTCGTTSTTYNTFMYLSLPIPTGKGISQVTLSQCIDFFTQMETLDGDDAWNCSKCKVPRRATKALTISRLPPILLIHLKRFSFHGPFTDKIDTAVMFPVRGLDMTPHMPTPLSPHIKAKYEHAVGHSLDEPTSQLYDLHAVSNHFGNLSSGHYTAFVRSRGHWHDLNDSKIGRLTETQVASANKSAYTLWYGRRA